MQSTITLEIGQPTITLTEGAITRVRQLMDKRGNPNLSLRLGVKGGGCSGLSYTLNLEEAPTDRDFVLEQEGLRVFVDKRSARFLDGLHLDFSVKNLLEGGWVWTNPNAQRSCGCGTSFTPK